MVRLITLIFVGWISIFLLDHKNVSSTTLEHFVCVSVEAADFKDGGLSSLIFSDCLLSPLISQYLSTYTHLHPRRSKPCHSCVEKCPVGQITETSQDLRTGVPYLIPTNHFACPRTHKTTQ
jgi:hypothetical protein